MPGNGPVLPPDTAPRRNLYGRRHGKTLRPSQRSYLAEDLDALCLRDVTAADNPDRLRIDPGRIFGDDRPLWLEVGFGGGEHMVSIAAAHPQVGVLGAEPFINGIAMMLGKLRAAQVGNIRIHPGDARELMELLPDAAIARVFLNYPDPWPKARHHRRRFVTPDYLQPLARIMAPGGLFHVASDIPDYLRQAREEGMAAGFTLIADDAAPWEGWPSTRYEAKALREGRVPHYLTFRR